jgi:hypothetical protein
MPTDLCRLILHFYKEIPDSQQGNNDKIKDNTECFYTCIF